jgi:hypothetical protein
MLQFDVKHDGQPSHDDFSTLPSPPDLYLQSVHTRGRIYSLESWGKQKWGASGFGANKMVGQALPSPKYTALRNPEGKAHN